jgi:7-cyano-7-deazaguanine synthase
LSRSTHLGTSPAATRLREVAVLFSGGIDSAILLNELLRHGRVVVPIRVRTGCAWDDIEARSAARFLAAIKQPNLANLVTLDLPLGDLFEDHWSVTGRGVPDATTTSEAVFLPGRNPLLLIKPWLWCSQNGVPELALATLASNPFDDATPKFFARFESLMEEATDSRTNILRPFETLTKSAVMELGAKLPLELTFSCLAPINRRHCGRCNKCAERQAAFNFLPAGDPTDYAAVVAPARQRG